MRKFVLKLLLLEKEEDLINKKMETDRFVLNDQIEKLLLARSLLRKEPATEESRATIKAINEELAQSCWTPEIAADLTAKKATPPSS